MKKPLEIKGIRFGEGRPVICVPVVEREREAVTEKIRALAGRQTQMIEWRADCFEQLDQPEQVRGILEDIGPFVKDTVMLFTIRTKHQGGNADLEEKRLLYLDEIAAKSGSIDLIDLEHFELDRPEREITRLQKMGVHVISSHHDFSGTPHDVVLHTLMNQLTRGGGDIAKIAVMPQSADDVARLFQLTNETRTSHPDLPLIAIAMGALGVISRVSGETFGSCVTFGADGECSAPGQLQADELAGILNVLHESMTNAQGDERDG
ncbi:MAG: type I 3-dehydroquinate dehydratase [Lachnospiraceae bacterium]|nr:type I 3-dehydroquinate dehydratase [Lachnospiraceae bacterium]